MAHNRTIAQFSDQIAEASKAHILELMVALKPYRDAIILVGGWMPYFLLQRFQRSDVDFQHIGSIDIDLAVNPKLVGEREYARIIDLITQRGYKPTDKSKFSFKKEVTLPNGKVDSIQVDFLGPEYGGTGKGRQHQRVQEDFLLRKARGADFAFDHYIEVELTGRLPNKAESSVTIKVADVVSCLTMKGMAIGGRYYEKDAYDIFSVIAYYKNGPVDVANEVKPYLKNKLVREGIEGIANKFRTRNAEGPAWVADFEIAEGETREQRITDAYMQVQRFLLALYEPPQPPKHQETITPEQVPVLDIEPHVGGTGGTSGHFVHFQAINIGEKVAIDCRWGIRGFAYEWRSPETFILRPSDKKRLEYKISDEKPFHEIVPEFNIFFEYKDNRGVNYFSRRELVLEKVPSGAFYNITKVSTFHPAVVLEDTKIRSIEDLPKIGDREEVMVKVDMNGQTKEIHIGISGSLLAIFGFSTKGEIKAALAELTMRKVRNMFREGKLQDHVFTSEELPQRPLSGLEAYKELRDSLDR